MQVFWKALGPNSQRSWQTSAVCNLSCPGSISHAKAATCPDGAFRIALTTKAEPYKLYVAQLHGDPIAKTAASNAANIAADADAKTAAITTTHTAADIDTKTAAHAAANAAGSNPASSAANTATNAATHTAVEAAANAAASAAANAAGGKPTSSAANTATNTATNTFAKTATNAAANDASSNGANTTASHGTGADDSVGDSTRAAGMQAVQLGHIELDEQREQLLDFFFLPHSAGRMLHNEPQQASKQAFTCSLARSLAHSPTHSSFTHS